MDFSPFSSILTKFLIGIGKKGIKNIRQNLIRHGLHLVNVNLAVA
jgi:hypothetical protein